MEFPSNSTSFFPADFLFRPTDVELVGYYLYNRIASETLLAGNNLIRETDLCGSQEPSDIWRLFGGDDLEDEDQALYFFTKLKKKSSNGSSISRTVASGTWAGEDSGQKIIASNVVGFKKRFRYENPKSPQHQAWIMHEFTIDSHEIVICRMKRNMVGQRDRKRKLSSIITQGDE